MKLVAIAVSLGLAAPAFACPNMDHDEAPKTVEKKQEKTDTAKAKEQPKQDQKKDTKDQQKPASDTAKKDKKGDKVSSR